MKYFEPLSMHELMQHINAEDDYKCLAGGATLVAMMNAGLIEAESLISLQGIEELKGITVKDDTVRIGAMTTHSVIASTESLTGNASVVRDAAGKIAHSVIRNMGTIGGAVCHADPSADFPAALVAANATIEAIGPSGQRSISIDSFFLDYLETSLEEKEIVTAVIVPLSPVAAFGHHLKFSRVDGDYATVSISLVIDAEGGVCRYARIAVGSVGPVPLHLEEADEALMGSALTDSDLARAGEILMNATDPVDDVRGTSEYRRLLVPRLLRQAVSLSREKLH